MNLFSELEGHFTPETIQKLIDNNKLVELHLDDWITAAKKATQLPGRIMNNFNKTRKEVLMNKRTFKLNASRRYAIQRLIRDGATFEDFAIVHSYKTKQWLGTKMESHITPECFYRDSNFWRYLEAANNPKTLDGRIEKSNRAREIAEKMV